MAKSAVKFICSNVYIQCMSFKPNHSYLIKSRKPMQRVTIGQNHFLTCLILNFRPTFFSLFGLNGALPVIKRLRYFFTDSLYGEMSQILKFAFC